MYAIQQANRILEWQENLSRDEMPPVWMWHLEHELDRWFEEVDRKRKERFHINDDDGDTDTSQMMQNELARGRR